MFSNKQFDTLLILFCSQVSFRGDGIIQGLQAIAEATGQVKGSIGNPAADPPLQANGKLDVGGAVGQGTHYFKLHPSIILNSDLTLPLQFALSTSIFLLPSDRKKAVLVEMFGRWQKQEVFHAGVLAVVRNHPEWERPYTGIVEIASGEIAEDLAKYLVESEQQNAAIALGVSIDREAGIRAAGGFLIQVPSVIED